ncbi:MAG: hypothetical protein ACRDMV_25245 [Streptosporangiales bacterium]
MTGLLTIDDHDGRDTLHVRGRHRRPVSDEVMLTCEHRTTRQGGSVVLDAGQAADLWRWLGWWLEHGWDGVAHTDPRGDTP